MAFVIDFVCAIVGPVVEPVMVPVKKHVGYWISCTKYVRDMDIKKKELDATRLGVENHMAHNKSNHLEVPPEVSVWLEEVEKIDAKVKGIPSDVGSCFSLKLRHKLGRKAFKIIEEIKSLIEKNSTINWTDHPIPLGKVDSMKASTSTPSTHHNEFKSRELTFKKALEALQADHKSHMIALCGMGGVGKTTMMQKLKMVVSEKKMFDYIIEAAIGEKTNPIVIQQAVAEFLSVDLKDQTTKEARAIKLRKCFEAKYDGGKKKILVILDDVWQFVDMNDIGLSPLPNQGVDFKVLLTSRDREVCTQMGVKVDSILNMEVLTNPEAQSFFHQLVTSSDDADLDFDLRKIGDDIAIRCHGLPIAIKTIAYTLKHKSKHVWEDTLSRLKHHDVDEVVSRIFEISYNNLQNEETGSTLLLCGLFPEDFNIPTEDLMRYGWGLKLFNNVYTIQEARNRLNTCIERLINANLLIQSQKLGCVKMHDLVRVFVLDKCSKGKHASIVGNMSKRPTKHATESCKRISLTCTGMPEFPREYKYPNLLLLKLMNGDELLRFPQDFYEEMESLEVIAYESMKYPLLPRSLHCSTNLRTLCLHQCSLMFDCSSIGNLWNLEVLSFANCGIRKLPSTIGNLKELKLLDLSGCIDLRIDDGALKKLVNLEELYMRVGKRSDFHDLEGIRLTDANVDELVERSKKLIALEIEFFDRNTLPKNMSFKYLERFKISLGCYLNKNDGQNQHSFDNKLMLVTNKCELLDSGINELFEKTEVLHLQVDDMNDLGDGMVESLHHHQFSFYKLRVLEICKCANLKYLFTVHLAHSLTKLERLTISSCHVLETLVDGEISGVEAIKFQALKFLSLDELPKLMSLCNDVNVIELPQLEELRLDSLPNFTSICADNESATSSSKSNDIGAMQPFLKKEVIISHLKILNIRNMEKLKEIWPSNSEEVGFSNLREIEVVGCDNLVSLFPSNLLMLLLHHLKDIYVSNCASIDVLFDIDLRCVGEMEGGSNNLRRIVARGLRKLREVWRVKGAYNSNHPILGFQAVEYIRIVGCKSLRNVFTPTTIDLDMRALKEITIDGIDGWGENKSDNEMVESSQKEEISVISNKEISEVDDNIPSVAFPSYLIHAFNHPRTLQLSGYKGVEVVFEIESSSSRKLATTRNNQQPLLLPYLENLVLYGMESITHVWEYNWNKLLMSRQESESSFHNLTNITLEGCNRIKYLFSPLMAKHLSNLKNVKIYSCEFIEEVVSNRDDENEEIATSISSDTNTNFSPHLDILYLERLQCLKRIDGVGAKGGDNKRLASNITNVATSVHDKVQCNQVGSLCQYSKKIVIWRCDALLYVIPSHAVGQLARLDELHIDECRSMREIFEINNDVGHNTNVGEGSGDTMTIPRLTNMTNLLELPNLKRLNVYRCDLLENIFTSSTLESLKKLEELEIKSCMAIQVIVKEENGEHSIGSKDHVVFPRLKSLKLRDLPNLKGFFLGKNIDFQWPLLDHVEIYGCPQMMIFTAGHSMAPKLNYIHTGIGKHSLECGLNFDWTSAAAYEENEVWKSSVMCSTPPDIINLLQFPCSFSNLIHMDVNWLTKINTIFPCNEFVKLQNNNDLEKPPPNANATQALIEETNDAAWMEANVIIFSKQKQVTTTDHPKSCIWKTTFNLSNLTTVSIEELNIYRCRSMREIFESDNYVGHNTNVGEGSGDTMTIPRLTNMTNLLELSNLKRMCIEDCCLLENIFTSSTLESLKKLEELIIASCMAIQVIVKEENGEHSIGSKDVVFPHLKSLKLGDLPSLKGFFLGKNIDFQWPLLDDVKIYGCPQMMIFTAGHSMAPKLNYIHTGIGKHSLECGLNFAASHEENEVWKSSVMCSTPPDIINLLQFPWSFSNLVHMEVRMCENFYGVKSNTTFPCKEFLKLQNNNDLEKPPPDANANATQALIEETNDAAWMEANVIIFSKQKQVTTTDHPKSCIWKTTLNGLSNLTRVSIDFCGLVEHVFCYCMVGSLVQLQELNITFCNKMEVIVKQAQDSETKANEELVMFPCLKSLKLYKLRSLKGFYLGREAFQWPSLDTLEIEYCPEITVFTNGQLTTPKLRAIKTSFGFCGVTEEDVNSFIRTKKQEEYQF